MTDSKIRNIERRWKKSGLIEDEIALLAEKARHGDEYSAATVELCSTPIGLKFIGAQTYSSDRWLPIARFEHSKTGLVFHLLPAGTFMMGSPEGEVGGKE